MMYFFRFFPQVIYKCYLPGLYLAIAAMHRRVVVGRESLLHSRGEVVCLRPGGYCVRVQSERWEARCEEPLEPGDAVEVTGVEGPTLWVTGLTGVENDRL
jgi:membrane-bound ClpP family serine protease